MNIIFIAHLNRNGGLYMYNISLILLSWDAKMEKIKLHIWYCHTKAAQGHSQSPAW